MDILDRYRVLSMISIGILKRENFYMIKAR